MKIHLLMTCLLTDHRIQPTGYYQVEESDKLEQVLSTLESLRSIEFSSSEIRITMDAPYEQHRELLRECVQEWHPRANVSESRLETFLDWSEAVARIPSDVDWVLLMANHDHVFVNRDAKGFHRYLESLLEEGISEIAHVSHWTEALGWRVLKFEGSRPPGLGLCFQSESTIGTVAVRLSEFRSWFEVDFTEGSKFVRPDNPFGPSVQVRNEKQALPMEEFFRHLDGYGHVGLDATYASTLRPKVFLTKGIPVIKDYVFGNPGEPDVDLLVTPSFYSDMKVDEPHSLSNLLFLATAYRVRLKILYGLLLAAKGSPVSICLAVASIGFSRGFWCSLSAPLLTLLFAGRAK